MAIRNNRMALVCAGLAVSSALIVAAAQAQDVSFEDARNFPAGRTPWAVAVGDFNGDGLQDLAVADNGSNNVVVLLGNGDGTFQPARNFAVGGGEAVAVGDFNGDGAQDLAVTTYDGDGGFNRVSVLLGNGDGTFQEPLNFDVGRAPSSVAVGDFNGDGAQDLVSANFEASNVSVLLGNGDGSFQTARNFGVGYTPWSVAVGDFNRDGQQDLAVANYLSYNVVVLLGNGDGSFQTARNFSAGGPPVSISVGDFNGDGAQDLTVAIFDPFSQNRSVSVLLGNRDGSFQAPRNFLAGRTPWSVTVGDFNGDGLQDLAVANRDSNNVSVLLGNGDGSFQTARNFAVGGYLRSVAVGDFNGDGRPDLAVATSYDVSVLINNTPQ